MPSLPVATNTTALLAEMKQPGEFESLWFRVMYIAEPRYRRVIATGTNARGVTIAAPMDGIGRDGEDELVFEATLDKDLRRKWLAPKKGVKEGDLRKAARVTSEHASVTVVLGTNGPVDRDLFDEVQETARTLGVTVDIWDQSRIATVLDSTHAGHALRFQYFDIPPLLLSRELLAFLGERSAREHAATLFTPNDARPRALVDDIDRTLQMLHISLELLQGSSGHGKSTAAHHAMRRWIENDGVAVWVPARLVAEHDHVHAALQERWTQLAGGEKLQDAAESLSTLFDARRPLVVVVDDLRDLPAPGAALRKLTHWSKPIEGAPRRIVFVVPVWPQMTDEVAHELRDAAWVATIEVGTYSREESLERVPAVPMSAADAETFAALLGDDPFLIGRWSDLVRSGKTPSQELARNTLANFVEDELRKTAAKRSFTDVAELEEALVELSRSMMQHRNARPTISTAKKWLTSEQVQLVDAITKQARILVYPAGRQTITFRHDRLQEHFFSLAARELLDGDDEAHVISDPYFARAIGMALAAGATEHLPRVAKEAPLALFEALRFTSDGRIFAAAKRWLEENTPHPELEKAILLALAEAETPIVRELAEMLPPQPLQRIARVRHGDANAAIEILRSEVVRPRFENAVEHARMRHRAAMVRATKKLLREDPEHALPLAGHLALPELSQPILQCWKRSSRSYKLTANALWAAARCAGEDADGVVGPIFDHFLRHAVLFDRGLRRAFAASPPSRPGATAMVKRASAAGRDARAYTLLMLQTVDHPDVFRLHVEDAEVAENIAETFATEAQTSDESREVLREVWEDKGRSEKARKAALLTWAASATPNEAAVLSAFAEDPLLARLVTLARARLGDATAAPALAQLGAKNTADLTWAHRVWSPELRKVVEAHLQALAPHAPDHHPNAEDDLARVLRHVPTSEAEEMFETQWARLRACPLFIQSAIVVGTPRTLALAHEAVAALPPDVYAFAHLPAQFGFHNENDRGLRAARPETVLTTRHLDALSDFTPAIRVGEIHQVFNAAQSRLWFSWIEANFERWTAHVSADEREPLRRSLFPTDEDLRTDFESYDAHSVARFASALGVDPHRMIDIVVRAAQAQQYAEAWDEAMRVLAHVGTRADLARVEPLLPDDEQVRSSFDDVAFAIRRRTLE